MIGLHVLAIASLAGVLLTHATDVLYAENEMAKTMMLIQNRH